MQRSGESVVRPINAFFLFNSENRKRICEENTGLDKVEISRLLGRLWKALDSDQKQDFSRRAAELRPKCDKRSEYPFDSLSTRRMREKKSIRNGGERSVRFRKVYKFISIPVPQIHSLSDQLLEPGVCDQPLDSMPDPVLDEKLSFMEYLGLCPPDSVRYKNILRRHRMSAIQYPMLVLREVRIIKKVKRKQKSKTEVETNQVKRPRGRPRKRFPKEMPIREESAVNDINGSVQSSV